MTPFPSRGRRDSDVLAEVQRLRARDTSFMSGRILGSMCTAPHPVAVETYGLFIETNLGDPALFPGARELEERGQRMVLDLLGAPATPGGDGGAGDAAAMFVSGGSEANFTGLRIARDVTGRREVVLPETAHFSFDKAAAILGMTLKHAPVTEEYVADVDAVQELVGPDTACVVAVAGTTELGTVDPVPQLAEVARDAGAHCHVDAALGGFVIPFTGLDLPAFDLRVEGVDTVTVDPHKMGLAPIPTGVVAARTRRHFEAISTPTPYVSTEKQATLTGTRPGAAPAAAYAAMRSLGREGYERIVHACLYNARYLHQRVRAMGGDTVMEPVLNVVAIRCRDPPATREALRAMGFHVALAPQTGGVKVVVMPHVTRNALEEFLPALEDVLAKGGDLRG